MRTRNKEWVKRHNRTYYAANRERIKARQRELYWQRMGGRPPERVCYVDDPMNAFPARVK